MLHQAKTYLHTIWGENPKQIRGLNYTLEQQEAIIYSHLILMNHGFGDPHPFWSLGERLLGLWVDSLIDAHCELTSIGEVAYIENLHAYYREEADRLFSNGKRTNILRRLLQPLGEKHFNQLVNGHFDFIDLFAGIGGFHQAMHSVGGHCVFASEWDKYARISYEANYKDIAPNLFENDYRYFNCDINDVRPEDIPNFDVCCGGFPCQAFSIAGLKRGFEDTRGTLFFNIANIVRYKKEHGHAPKVLLLENVKGLKSHDKGNTLRVILATLDELHYGYCVEVLNAKYFGVPQNRERLFIVAWDLDQIPDGDFRFPYGIDEEGNVIYEKERVATDAKETHICDIFEPRATIDASYTISDRMWIGHQERKRRNKENGKGFGYSLFPPDAAYSSTISARYWKDGSEILIDQSSMGLNPRKLTPTEAGRLQGYNIQGNGWEKMCTGLTTHEQMPFNIVVSKKEAYHQFGNSVAVPVIKRLAAEIVKQLM